MARENPSGMALSEAAAALVGCRFRLHGRDPATGLDCLGVLGAALAAVGQPRALPSGYGLRPGPVSDFAARAAAMGFAPATAPIGAGDVWLTRPGPGQLHLAIVAPDRAAVVEAHAGIGRVVLTPLAAGARPEAAWRLNVSSAGA